MAPTQVTDPDGSWECPFCGYGFSAERGLCRGQKQGYREDCGDGEHCQNPACFANPHYPVERAREVLATEERKRAEEAQRVEAAEFCRRYAEEQAAERRAKIHAIRKEAESRGACIRCALKDAPYREPKFIKHRTRCPLEPRP